MVDFPEKPSLSGLSFTEWQIKYRTPINESWQYLRLPISALVDNLTFSFPGFYEFEVTAVDPVEGVESVAKVASFREYMNRTGV